MSRLGKRMIQAADEALAIAAGERNTGYVLHKPVDVKAIRAKLGLAQPEFARRFGLSVGTIRDWEQGRVPPDRAAIALLRVIDAAPDVARKILEPAD